jgi:hypothetical protein
MAVMNIASSNVGALSNAARAIFKVPTGYGGVRIVEAKVISGGASGTSWLTLDDLGTAGTAASTRIGTGGTVIRGTANLPQSITLTAANCYVAEGHYVGVTENNLGACDTVTIVEVAFLVGK